MKPLIALTITEIVLLGIILTSSHTIVYRADLSEPQRILEAVITAYSELDSCHYDDCIMASGIRAYIGAVACPRHIKLSTRVFIDGTPYICEDRYNKDLSDRFDIFFGYGQDSHEKAKQFGVQKKEVSME
ncbi:MAG: hypothetical protein AABY22_07700 [Nanoarchaeota archaeon]